MKEKNIAMIGFGIMFLLFLTALVSGFTVIETYNEDARGENSTIYGLNLLSLECEESWSCTGWTACSGSTQTRTCTDANKCGTTDTRPTLSQSCTTGDTGGSGGATTPSNDTIDLTGNITEDYGELADKNYSMVVRTNKYAYLPEEPLEVMADVFLEINDTRNLYDSDRVFFDLLSGTHSFGRFELTRYDFGRFAMIYEHTLQEGHYLIRMVAQTDEGYIVKDRDFVITTIAPIQNVIRVPSKRLVWCILILILLIIILLVVLYVRRHYVRKKNG